MYVSLVTQREDLASISSLSQDLGDEDDDDEELDQ
jgi:hypothetical protein